MFGKIVFNVLSPYHTEMTKNNVSVLKRYGFKVLDLQEADIVRECDGSLAGRVYILRCQGKKRDYENFKKRFKWNEIIYEETKTLTG